MFIDLAAYRNTPYASLHNVATLQMHKPQHNPIIDRWIDKRNNMPPPSRPGPTSPSPAHSAELDLTKLKNESELMSIDLSASTQKNDSSLNQIKDHVNGQITSLKIETIDEKAISVIAQNPLKVTKSEAKMSSFSDGPDCLSIQKVKTANNIHHENKYNKQDKGTKDVIDNSIKIEVADTNNVEKMLENIFQTNESEKLSVIKTIKPIKSPSPSLRAESVEKILKSPSPIPRIELDKSEGSISHIKSSKKVHDSHSDSKFLEVENKLEELFSGVATSNSINDQQIITDNKPKQIISSKRPYNKNKKQIKKIKKIIPSTDKLKSTIEPTNKKYKGPLIRINGGNIDNPKSFVIINKNIQDDEDLLDGRNVNRKTYCEF